MMVEVVKEKWSDMFEKSIGLQVFSKSRSIFCEKSLFFIKKVLH